MNEELNKKLAEWVGFNYRKIGQGHRPGFVEFYDWVYPDESTRPLPDFTESLDAIFQWLVPKVLEKFGEDATLELLTEWVQSLILTYTIDQAPNILAKAIEQLIDKEK